MKPARAFVSKLDNKKGGRWVVTFGGTCCVIAGGLARAVAHATKVAKSGILCGKRHRMSLSDMARYSQARYGQRRNAQKAQESR